MGMTVQSSPLVLTFKVGGLVSGCFFILLGAFLFRSSGYWALLAFVCISNPSKWMVIKVKNLGSGVWGKKMMMLDCQWMLCLFSCLA